MKLFPVPARTQMYGEVETTLKEQNVLIETQETELEEAYSHMLFLEGENKALEDFVDMQAETINQLVYEAKDYLEVIADKDDRIADLIRKKLSLMDKVDELTRFNADLRSMNV